MTELTAAESSVMAAIEGSPGISAGDLSKRLQRRTQDVLRTVDSLVGKGQVERRQTERTQTYAGPEGRIVSRTRSYNGLFALTAPPRVSTTGSGLTKQFWWKRTCLQDTRMEVVLRKTPSLEGTTTWDGPWSMDEAVIHREAGIPRVLIYQSELMEQGPPAPSVETPADPQPVRGSRGRSKAPDPDADFLKALTEV